MIVSLLYATIGFVLLEARRDEQRKGWRFFNYVCAAMCFMSARMKIARGRVWFM